MSLTNRGFTGHEHLPAYNIINMNGRVYDPVVARFLSADDKNIIPKTTQDFNRYSYVLNNPLKYTDPSGWFNVESDNKDKKERKNEIRILKQIIRAHKKETKNWGAKEWAVIKEKSGLSKKQYTNLLKNSNKDVTLKFGVLTASDGKGNYKVENRVPQTAVGQQKGKTITLDYSIKQGINSINLSNENGRETNSMVVSGENIQTNKLGDILEKEMGATLNYAQRILMHETVHYGASINGLPDSPITGPDDEGSQAEIGIYGKEISVEDTDFGFSIYNRRIQDLYRNAQENLPSLQIPQFNLIRPNSLTR